MAFTNPQFIQWFDPFRYIDVARTYGQFSSIIDFFLFLTVFTGLAQLAFHKRFPGRPGQAIAIAFGVALALAFSIFEHTHGLSLRNLGPFAATLVVVVVGILVIQLVRAIGLPLIPSVIVAVTLTYMGASSLLPAGSVLLGIMQLIFFVGMLVAILVGAKKVVGSLIERSSPETESERHRQLKREQQVLQDSQSDASQLYHAQKTSIKDLKDAYDSVQKQQLTSEVIVLLDDVIRRTRDREMVVRQKLEYLGILNRQLEQFDLGVFKKLKSSLDSLPPKDQQRAQRELDQERRKIARELRADTRITGAEELCSRLELALERSRVAIKAGNSRDAGIWLSEAIELDETLTKDLDQVVGLEKKLFKLTQWEVRHGT